MVLLVLAICLAPSFVSAQFSDVLAVKVSALRCWLGGRGVCAQPPATPARHARCRSCTTRRSTRQASRIAGSEHPEPPLPPLRACVQFNGSSQAVEAHVLDARADGASPPYKSFKLQVPTVFKDAAHSSFQHLVNIETGDLFAIKVRGVVFPRPQPCRAAEQHAR